MGLGPERLGTTQLGLGAGLVSRLAFDPPIAAVALGDRWWPKIVANKRDSSPRGVAVVGHDALNHHASVGEPGDCSGEEVDGGVGAFIGEHFDVRHSGAVVDADVHDVPAGPWRVAASTLIVAMLKTGSST